jgi:hypothetical protein
MNLLFWPMMTRLEGHISDWQEEMDFAKNSFEE